MSIKENGKSTSAMAEALEKAGLVEGTPAGRDEHQESALTSVPVVVTERVIIGEVAEEPETLVVSATEPEKAEELTGDQKLAAVVATLMEAFVGKPEIAATVKQQLVEVEKDPAKMGVVEAFKVGWNKPVEKKVQPTMEQIVERADAAVVAARGALAGMVNPFGALHPSSHGFLGKAA